MTLYWWNHWFWITIISATLPFTSVATYPISSPSLEHIEDNNPNDNKNTKLPLEFPLLAQTDVDDIIAGSENIPRTLLIKEEIIEKLNNEKDDSLSAVALSSSLSTSTSSSGQDRSKVENQLSDRSVKDVDQSIENQKENKNNGNVEIKSKSNSKNITNSNNNNNNGDPNSSKSVIQLIPKAINQKNNQENLKELDSHTSESDISSISSPSSSILNQNMKKQSESLDVVSFDNNNHNNSNSNGNDTINSNVSNISTNISLGEKLHEQLKILTTSNPSTTTPATTGEYKKSVSHIMQVTKSSSKIKSKTGVSGSSDSNSNENISTIVNNLDETTMESDSISMTTILHPVDEINTDTESIKLTNDSSSNGDEMTSGKIPITLENVTKLSDKSLNKDSERVRKSKGLSSEYRDGFINNYSSDAKSLLTRSAGQEDDFNERNHLDDNGGNVSSEALQRAYVMDAGTISGICLSVLAICCGVGTFGIVLYRRRFLNKPQALSEPDSSVYIDDSTIRDNSDEMYSLDNDSFLNSLEAMTIQNYWTDTVKHTKL